MNRGFNAIACNFPAAVNLGGINTGHTGLGQCTDCFFIQGYVGSRGRAFHGFDNTHDRFPLV
nr:MAG TPA: hypothetical protein [Caudoviricetes sp.]